MLLAHPFHDAFDVIMEPASPVGAATGAPRPLIDEGRTSREHQVGFRGNIARPKIYIAIGASGDPRHVVGVKDGGAVIPIPINTDAPAPIGEHGGYMIAGGLCQVAPKLIEEIRKLKGKKR